MSTMRDRGGPAQPLLLVTGLRKYFPLRGPLGNVNAHVQAVDGIGFNVMKGETLGIVGEFRLLGQIHHRAIVDAFD